MTDDGAERTRRTRSLEDALARGQAALAASDRPEAVRWLDRAHRLAPGDGSVALLLASVLISVDNARAASLFAELLAVAELRDALLGQAAVRLLEGDAAGASAALSAALSRHAWRSDMESLAGQVARLAGAAGWCALSGDGVLVVHATGDGPIIARMDGETVAPGALPAAWTRHESVIVTAGGRSMLGSPISLPAISRVEGRVEADSVGISGWVWQPGDPERAPVLSVAVGRTRTSIAAADPAEDVRALPPFARPRRFALAWADVPAGAGPIHVRGRDGRDLPGSPFTRRGIGEPRQPPVPAAAPFRRRGPRLKPGQESVILITHDDGGGVERRVCASVAEHEAHGRRAIVLRPTLSPEKVAGVAVDDGHKPPIRFDLPRERAALLRMLRGARPRQIELHHLLNHDASLLDVVRDLGVPFDVHTHDFAWFCPRIALVGDRDRYCGEPTPDLCEACVARNGTYLPEPVSVAALLERSRGILTAARRVIAPSRDAADRMARHFPGLAPVAVPHEDDSAIAEPPPIPRTSGTVRVCLVGAIGLHKGFHVLLACARDARKRDLDLTFLVAGTTIDDQRLMDTGRVFVTGPYQPEEAVALIRRQHAALALLPSIWPETWCLGLSELWRAGLRVVAFDIGAPAERIRQTGRGILLPLGLSPAKINDVLLNAARGRSFLPIRRASAYKPSQ